MLDVLFGDEVDAVDVLGDDLAGERAGFLDGDALGQRIAADRAMTAFDDILHRRVKLGLDPDDLDAGPDRLGRRGNAADQPAATDRDDEHVEVGDRGEHFERDGAGPRDYRGSSNGWTKTRPRSASSCLA